MIKAIVTDIEGTTSSLSFVKDVLFPYAREHLADYVQAHHEEPTVQGLLKDAADEAGIDYDLEAIITQLIAWIDADKKVTPLKALQGLMWQSGYEQGDFTGHIYDDAVNVLKHWHASEVPLYVYSSGSVFAQKLLFAHTDFGDLNYLFSGYFDTQIGAKLDASSYAAIVRQLGLAANQVLFLSDIEQELHAAREAGLQVIKLVRDPAQPLATTYASVRTFTDIDLTQFETRYA